MCISCRPHVDVHKGRGSGSCGRMWTEGVGVKNLLFVDVINRWPVSLCTRTFLKCFKAIVVIVFVISEFHQGTSLFTSDVTNQRGCPRVVHGMGEDLVVTLKFSEPKTNSIFRPKNSEDPFLVIYFIIWNVLCLLNVLRLHC